MSAAPEIVVHIPLEDVDALRRAATALNAEVYRTPIVQRAAVILDALTRAYAVGYIEGKLSKT